MRYTMLFRDERGAEVTIADLKVIAITEHTILVCPRDERMTNMYQEVLREEFKRHGVDALVCNFPLDVFQLRTAKEETQ